MAVEARVRSLEPELQMLVVGTSYVGAGNELNSGSLDEQAVCALKG